MSEQMFRIVKSSSFDKDWYNEEFADGEVMLSKDLATIQCKHLNSISDPNGEHFYKVVPSGYKLHIGMVP